MQKNTIKNQILLTIAILLISFTSFSQDMMFEVPLSEQVANSSNIVEGKVISKNSFWDLNRQNIYTINTIEVYKSFKGNPQVSIDIITEGGTVDLTAQVTSLSLDLSIGDTGVFMLHDSNVQFSPENVSQTSKYEAYSAIQGFYQYDLFENKVNNPYISIEGISQQFYPRIMAQTQSNYVVVTQFDVDNHIQDSTANRLGGLVIANFSPASITAGTRSVLTIDGTGFGTTMGTVLFRDANSGGSTYFTALDSQIISWSDTQILVEVPSRAGTGTFRVVTSIGPFVNSMTALQVPYAEINVTSNSNVAYPTQHIDDGGNGGYIWSMYTSFFLNTQANQSFTRAFNSWRCQTGINWDISPTFTTVNTIAMDNTNVIRFDIANELPNGVLGRNTSYFNGCSNGSDLEWFVSELDIVFDSSVNWQFGASLPNNSQFDFETVAVHELGHGHQLAHVINPNAIMHYAIANGSSNRFLSTNDILGGNDVMLRNTTNPVCGNPLMTYHSCSLGVTENDLSNYISIFPNPAKNELFVKNNYHSPIQAIEMYDMTGRSVKKDKFLDGQELYTLNISDLSSGVYMININMEGKTLTEKLIID